MKVGIISMQRVVNYGSFLQAYSLKKNIENLGAEAEFIDYHTEPPIVNAQSGIKLRNPKEIISKLLPPYGFKKDKMSRFYRGMWEVEQDYTHKMLPLLNIDEEYHYNTKVDLLVIGSDEVFNCLQTNETVGYSRELFGSNGNYDCLISYAASFGNTNKEGLVKYGIYDEVKEMLLKFRSLSARDKNTYDLLHEMTGGSISKHVDPVFLYDYSTELEQTEVPLDNYIVVYAYDCRIKKEEARAIRKFACAHNKKIVCLCGPQRYLDGYQPLNAFEVLAYFKKADYVITDTFHGTVFSIKFNKNFVTFVRGGHGANYGNSEKLYDLLETFGLKSRCVTDLNKMANILENKPDYQSVNDKIAMEKQRSIEYLKEYVCREG